MFYSCAPSASRSRALAQRKIARKGNRSVTVDIHCHVHTPAADDLLKGLITQDVDYLRRLYFDTIMFDPRALGHLVELWGADHLLLGTDYPYDMGYYDPLGAIAAVKKLSAAERDAIAGGNAARLLGLRRPVAKKR